MVGILYLLLKFRLVLTSQSELLEFSNSSFFIEYINMKNVFIFSMIVFISSSCSFPGLFSDYKRVNKEYPTLLKHPKDERAILNAKYSDSCQVLVLNAEELATCLDTEAKTILYSWSPHCSSPYCYGLDRVQAYCRDKGIKLHVVADYYDIESMTAYYKLEFPIVGIDTKAYKNKLTPIYTKKFLEDLSIFRDKDNSDRLFYLEKGKFIRSFRVLEEIQ